MAKQPSAAVFAGIVSYRGAWCSGGWGFATIAIWPVAVIMASLVTWFGLLQ